MEKHAGAVAYATSACTVATGYLTLQDFTLIVGIATAIATFGLNWYFKAREDKRQERGHGGTTTA